MLSLAVAVVAIALPDCINPSLIGADLFLAAGEHPARRTIVFAIAAWAVTFLIGVALALGLGDLVLSILPKPGATLKYTLIAVAGIVVLVGGTVVWIRRETLGRSRQSHRGEPRSPALLGAGIAGVETLTAFPYFAAIAMIIGSNVSNSAKFALLVLYCLVYTLPLIGIAVLCAVMGKRAAGVVRPVVTWIFTRWPMIVGPLAAIIGVGLMAYGTVKLGST